MQKDRSMVSQPPEDCSCRPQTPKVNAGQQIFFQNSFGRPGIAMGFDDDWKDVGGIFQGSKIHPFSIRESAPKRRVFLVGESSQNCWFFV